MKKISMQTIASNCNVSRVSVYKALSGQPGLSNETKNKILDEALKLGYFYESNKLERSSKFIFLMDYNYYLDISEKFYNVIYREVGKALEDLNHHLDLLLFREDNIDELINNFKKINYNISGIIVAGQMPEKLLKFLSKSKQNILCFDYFNPYYNLNYIYLDNYDNSYILTNYLISKGHKKIAFAGDLNHSTAVLDRYFGYRKSLVENAIEYNDNLLIPDPLNNDISKLLDLNDLPTAIICHCDSAASIIYSFAKMNKIKIYDDISVVAFDNTFVSKDLVPKLSTIGIENTEYAKIIVNDMLRISSKKITGFRRLIKAEIFERESVKDINH